MCPACPCALSASGASARRGQARRKRRGAVRLADNRMCLTWYARRSRGSSVLFRVADAVIEVLIRTGKFEVVSSSLEGKFFVESPADAAQWGTMLEGVSHYRIAEVELSTRVLSRTSVTWAGT